MERWRKAVGVQDQVIRAQRLAHELNDGGRKTTQLMILLGLARDLATEIVEEDYEPIGDRARRAQRTR